MITEQHSKRGRLPTDISGAVSMGVIGRGAVGIVELIQLPDGRRFALKRLSGDWKDGSAAARFRREARIVADLDHPHIVRSSGRIDQRGAWIIMDYVAGPTLHDLLSSVPLSTANALALLEAVCEAASYAHGRGIVHRDIAPGNIMVKLDGTPVLADFGVATMVGAEHNVSLLTFRTAPGALIGTPSYMSPEASAGSGDVTSLWDVYSLGVLAYRLLVGHLPFGEEMSLLAILDAQINRAPPDPSTFGVDLPDGVTAALLRALEKTPEDRTPSATDLWNELGSAATEQWPQWRERVTLAVEAKAAGRGRHPHRPPPAAEATSQQTNVGGYLDGDGVDAAPRGPMISTLIEPTVFVPKAPRRKLRILLGVVAGAVAAIALIAATGGFSTSVRPPLVVEHVSLRLSATAGHQVTCSPSAVVVARITTDGNAGELTIIWSAGSAALGLHRIEVPPGRPLTTVSKRFDDGEDHQAISVRVSASTSVASATFNLRRDCR